MDKDLKLSFYSILYGMLFLIAVHYWSLIFTVIIQIYVLGFFIETEYLPFVRLMVLFFEILFIAKFLKRIIQKEFLLQSQMFNLFMVSILGIICWFLMGYFNFDARPFPTCGNSYFEENWYETYLGDFDRNTSLTKNIETGVYVIAILIYSVARINEMPEDKEINTES